jgi:hypothetical protein
MRRTSATMRRASAGSATEAELGMSVIESQERIRSDMGRSGDVFGEGPMYGGGADASQPVFNQSKISSQSGSS